MDLLIGVVTVLLGLGFIAAPWVLRVTSNSIASTTVVAGGVIVTLLGLQLARSSLHGGPRRGRRSRGGPRFRV